MSYALTLQENGLYLEPRTERLYEATPKGLYILVADLKNDRLHKEPDIKNLERALKDN